MAITASEYESILETAYLFSSPANRKHLHKSMGQADRGETLAIDIPDNADLLPQALRIAMKKN